MKYYAGIGSRETPNEIKETMSSLAGLLEEMGYTLRSGGADGADKAFEKGVSNFNNKLIYYAKDCTKDAMDYSSQSHPAWERLSHYVKKLMGRNAMQILGQFLDTPAQFVVCWTADGAEDVTTIRSGGTGQAIRIANANNIPVFNLANEDWLERLNTLLGTSIHYQ